MKCEIFACLCPFSDIIYILKISTWIEFERGEFVTIITLVFPFSVTLNTDYLTHFRMDNGHILGITHPVNCEPWFLEYNRCCWCNRLIACFILIHFWRCCWGQIVELKNWNLINCYQAIQASLEDWFPPCKEVTCCCCPYPYQHNYSHLLL